MEDLALVVNDSNPNKCVAERFLKQLDPVAKGFTFQTFDDLKGRNNPSLTKVLHGTLDEHWDALASLNIQGAQQSLQQGQGLVQKLHDAGSTSRQTLASILDTMRQVSKAS